MTEIKMTAFCIKTTVVEQTSNQFTYTIHNDLKIHLT